MKLSRRPMLAVIPAVALAGSMLTAPVAGAQSSLPIPEGLLGSASGSLNLGSLGGDTCGTEVVSGPTADGWFTPADETGPTFVADEDAPLGDGALKLSDSDDGTSFYKKSGANLDSVLNEDDEPIAISYDFKADGQAPALQLRVLEANVAGSDNGFATIVWSPADGDGDWTTADPSASADQFWVTRDVKNTNDDQVWLPRGQKSTLPEIVAHLNGNDKTAKLSEYGVQQTQDNSVADIRVDKFVFGCETTDFEQAPTGPDFGSLALGGGLALAAALAVGGGAFAIQNGMIQLPAEFAAMLPQ